MQLEEKLSQRMIELFPGISHLGTLFARQPWCLNA
jgi:hypothetical protein